jgi:GntR family transcriptional regulator/MocR family aminotransferase
MICHPPKQPASSALFLEQGYHDALLRKLARSFEQRSEIMAAALDQYMLGSYTPLWGIFFFGAGYLSIYTRLN